MVERHFEESHGVGFGAFRYGRVVGFSIGEAKGEGCRSHQCSWIEAVGVQLQAMGAEIGKAMIDEPFEFFHQEKTRSANTIDRWDAFDMPPFFKSVGFDGADPINLIRQL
jgi:hypothetical protein